ncbi:MAG: hypothetical protein Q8M95_13515 [Candidatus Methanoperedens sp.]|nr:hypothetical protein [Candidatus Methanoperedens sp.]
MNSDKKETVNEMVGFHEEIAKIQTAIADFESGHKLNIAIIAEPFAGRTTLLNEIEKMNQYKVTRLSFSSIVKNIDDVKLSEQSKRIVLIDDCQYLYERKIGGFEILECFLKSAVSSSHLFITTWNLFSWNYLDEVINIGKFFPVQIKLPKFTKDQIKECILSGYKENEIKFEEDIAFEKEKVFEPRKYAVTIKPLEKTINILYFKINYNILKVRLLKKEERVAIEDIIFEKIHRFSNGNPGVAKIVWHKSLEYPIIKPSKIKDESFNIELDYKESFVLFLILSMKSINNDELSEILGHDFQVDKIIFRLSNQGLIAVDDVSCIIRPEALKSIIEFLKKLRLVW